MAVDDHGESQKSEEPMSLLTELFSTLDKRSLGRIGDALGESDQTVSRGMQSAVATVLGGMSAKSDNPSLLRKVLDLAPSGTGGFSWANLASGITDPNSPGISTGKQVLSALFGGSEGAITQALGAGAGLQSGVMSSLLTMAAPMVVGFLGKRVHDEGMTMGGLGSLLQREAPAIRDALPAGVTNLLWPRVQQPVTESPVVAQTVTREKSSAGWLVPVLALALIPGLIWLFSHGRRTVAPAPAPLSGTANRMVPEIPEPARPAVVALPANINLYFDTGSTRLRPESQARLDEFVRSLAANRDARVTVNGYTDNVGNAASNMRLSEARANAVKGNLEHKGIADDHLTAQGFGEEDPVADNATAEGRSQNRHVTVGAIER